jgi:hypothetical protein
MHLGCSQELGRRGGLVEALAHWLVQHLRHIKRADDLRQAVLRCEWWQEYGLPLQRRSQMLRTHPPAEMHAQSTTTVGEHHLNELPFLRIALHLSDRNLNLLG